MPFPPIPKNPITLTINGWLVENYIKSFFNRFLPEYEYMETSGYRSEQKQAEMKARGLKPAKFSAHLYNLARDYVLTKNGRLLPDAEMKTIWETKIKPNWEGYTYFSPKQKHTNTGWIHGNIDRGTSKITGVIGLAAIVAGAVWTGKKVFKLKK